MPDQLLHTISTLGRISLDKFYSAYDEIQTFEQEKTGNGLNNRNIKRTAIRLLDALGHCEFDFEKRLVYACPPALVSLPSSGLPNAVLTGARTPLLISEIAEFIKCKKDSMSYRYVKQRTKRYLLPSTIFIDAVDQSLLESLAKSTNIEHKLDVPAAWSFANFSVAIEDVKESLFFKAMEDLTWYRETFSRDEFCFSKHNNSHPPQGLVCYTNPYNQQLEHLIWDEALASKVDRYWGRYVILAENNVNVLLYDSRHHLLAVPSGVPLPRILGKAAILCSGLAPESIESSGASTNLPRGLAMDVYRAVPPSIAQLISEKLSQDLILCNISLDEM